MYGHTLRSRKRIFFRYCFQAFSTEEILKGQIKDYFKINGKQGIITPKKVNKLDSKTFENKIKSPLMIYADFESICQKIMKSMVQKNLIRTNIKNVLLRVVAINYYLLVISLVSLLRHA